MPTNTMPMALSCFRITDAIERLTTAKAHRG